MTEIERIISKGVIPASFLCPEMRCEYQVSSDMKKIWAVEMDLYLEFARVCKKNGFRYWAIGGTVLGAIRHNGFIPWDDDMDVVMPREDYEKFLKVAQQDFEHPYFLQTPYTDPGYYVCFAKLRNTNTTGTSQVLLHNNFNQGIFLDIFPLDSCDPDKCNEDRNLAIPFMKQCGAAMKKGSKFLSEEAKEDVKKLCPVDPIISFEKVQSIMTNPAYAGSEYWWLDMFTGYSAHKLTWKKSYFEGAIKHKYEMIDVLLPSNWDEVLKTEFGDYMKFPPIEKRGCWHEGFIFDAEKSYKEYKFEYCV